MTLKFGPAPMKARRLRRWEAFGDGFVKFGQREGLKSFAKRHPWLFKAYVACASIRCAIHGHEYSQIVKGDYSSIDNVDRRTHCLFCGHVHQLQPGEWPRPANATAERLQDEATQDEFFAALVRHSERAKA